jgi:hypothetical protein
VLVAAGVPVSRLSAAGEETELPIFVDITAVPRLSGCGGSTVAPETVEASGLQREVDKADSDPPNDTLVRVLRTPVAIDTSAAIEEMSFLLEMSGYDDDGFTVSEMETGCGLMIPFTPTRVAAKTGANLGLPPVRLGQCATVLLAPRFFGRRPMPFLFVMMCFCLCWRQFRLVVVVLAV